MKVQDGKPHVIRSDATWSEGAGVVHCLPLLHRDAAGGVQPVEIQIPYQLLGAERVFKLLRDARGVYMEQLIASGRRRQAFAQQTFAQQDLLVKRWKALSAAEKQAEIRRNPTVTITHSVDFELGISILY